MLFVDRFSFKIIKYYLGKRKNVVFKKAKLNKFLVNLY